MSAEPRLYIDADLAENAEIALEKDQAHYLKNVMRLGHGATLKLFNGRDGEWRAAIDHVSKSRVDIAVMDRLRPQVAEPDLWLLFAPIKGKRIDAIAEKAGELGASEIRPVLTERTVVARVNTERLQANAREAAEQCERLTLPAVHDPVKLTDIVAAWPSDRSLLYADERANAAPIAQALAGKAPGGRWAVLIGPEGGFSPEEQTLVRGLAQAVPVSLGPRLLRADTAAFAALSVWQAHLGDWRDGDG
ncbi:MAG: 16S rRNA (uracil(1498)-N(3))-methyltransferase [Minwuia sp.]|uniref:16S rRNA (uracil(1498)-N(3))-methyltransferase n=1 Tax=Minwuia sp. TaxID=2493630 RepID=UPI003A850781